MLVNIFSSDTSMHLKLNVHHLVYMGHILVPSTYLHVMMALGVTFDANAIFYGYLQYQDL